MTSRLSSRTRWTVAVLAVVATLIVALVVQLRDDSPSTATPQAPAARDHRDADTAAALAGPRRR
ncbi:hypothetical protein B1T46_12470, partial [Mycobacterium kansasii]